MKGYCLCFVVLSGLLLSSCAGDFWTRLSSDQSQGADLSTSTESNTILSCLAEQQKLTLGEFKVAYKKASTQATEGKDAAALRLICLSLHDYASFKQLKSGIAILATYIKAHPDADNAGLLAIQMLMQRLEKELTGKWIQSNKNLDAKEGLQAENKELSERIETLEKSAEQDQKRIRELQGQIEQLKKIENIIKDRVR